MATGGAQPQFNGNALKHVNVPLPPLEVQKEIVVEIKGYQREISDARELIDRLEKKIQATIARVWGEDKETAAKV